jgi:hypothetical protein
MNEYPRVAGRIGNTIDLNVTFYHNGVPQAPAAIRRIDIFKGSIRSNNIVDQIILPPPTSPSYPGPLRQIRPGAFVLPYVIPSTFVPNEVYYDVWNYVGSPPMPDVPGTDELVVDLDNKAFWVAEYGQFMVFEDDWIEDDGLFTKKLAFNPLDTRIRKGEIKTIEINIIPVPARSFEYNRLAGILPNLRPTISFRTTNNEYLAGMTNIPCTIGIMQGHHKHPFVIQCPVDSTNILIGTYQYNISVLVGDQQIISEPFSITVE